MTIKKTNSNMRKFLFRGKRLDNGEWVYGDLTTYLTPKGSMTTCPAITTTSGTRGTWFVNPESVGQFTGLADISGVQIFEGDIVEFVLKPVRPSGDPETLTGVVAWQVEEAEFAIDGRPYGGCRYGMKFAPKGKIIGNIHDK